MKKGRINSDGKRKYTHDRGLGKSEKDALIFEFFFTLRCRLQATHLGKATWANDHSCKISVYKETPICTDIMFDVVGEALQDSTEIKGIKIVKFTKIGVFVS